MKLIYWLKMKFYDDMCSTSENLEKNIYLLNQYMKYKKLYEKR